MWGAQNFQQMVQFQNPQQFIPGDQLLKVNGREGANAFPTRPNSRYALFDENDDVLFIKQTDSANFPTIKRYRFVEEEETKKESEQFVTVAEFEKFKEEMLSNAKQLIRTAIGTENAAAE